MHSHSPASKGERFIRQKAAKKGLTNRGPSGKLDPLFTIPRAVRSAERGPASFFALLPVNPMEERERFVRGTLVATGGVVASGLAAFGLFRLWEWALGFAAGALVSLGSLRLIVATVARFTEQPSAERRGRRSWWIGSLVRLLAAAALLFLVVRYLPVNLIGLALGLLAVQIGMGGYLLVRWLLPGRNAVGQEQK